MEMARRVVGALTLAGKSGFLPETAPPTDERAGAGYPPAARRTPPAGLK